MTFDYATCTEAKKQITSMFDMNTLEGLRQAEYLYRNARIAERDTFPVEAPALCSQRGEANLVELTHELAYLTIRESPLFDMLRSGEVDKAAERLAAEINSSIDEWFAKEQAK